MSEAGRFLRYVTPGVVYAVEVFVLMLILRPDVVVDWPESLDTGHVIATALGALLVSGGLGYIFGTLHHVVHWCSWFGGLSAVDHTSFVRGLIQRGVLVLRDSTSTKEISETRVTRAAAWVLLSGLWHERSTSSEGISGASPRMWTLADLVHSTGAARVASAFAGASALIIAAIVSTPTTDAAAVARFIAALGISILLVIMHQLSYQRVGKFFQGLIEQVLATTLARERDQQRSPIQVDVSDIYYLKATGVATSHKKVSQQPAS